MNLGKFDGKKQDGEKAHFSMFDAKESVSIHVLLRSRSSFPGNILAYFNFLCLTFGFSVDANFASFER